MSTLRINKLQNTSATNVAVTLDTSNNVLVGSATSTGTASQPLQVTGGAYVSDSVGVGTTTPINKLDVIGNTYVSGSVGVGTTAPASTVKLDVIGGIKGTIVQGTSQVSTAGTAIDFTGIPSWAKRVTVMFSGVSLSGTSYAQIQLGTSSGVENTGYVGVSQYFGTGSASQSPTAGAQFINASSAASALIAAQATITNVTGNTWVIFGMHGLNNTYSGCIIFNKTLSGTLDRVRITTVNGSDTFDAGSMNILYEG